MSGKKLIFRQDLQILRGVAILFVFLYHLKLDFFKNGFLGVDIFFVISGFLMMYRYEKLDIKSFYAKRSKKLLPAFFITLLIVLIFTFFITIAPDFNKFLKQFTTSIFLSSNFHYWSMNSYFNLIDFKPLLHLWSLCLEFQFYLLFPLILLLNKKYLLVIGFLSFFFSIIMCSISPKTSFFLLPFRLWEFVFGIFIACRYKDSNNNELSYFNSLVLLIVIIFLITLPIQFNSNNFLSYHPGPATLCIIILTSIAIYWGINKNLQQNVCLRFLGFLGKYSYAIYLVHFPAIVLYNYNPLSGTILNVRSFFDFISIVIIVSFFSCIINFFYKKRLNTKSFFILIIICTFPILFIKDLKNHKISKQQSLIFESINDRSTYRCGKKFRLLNPFSNLCNIGEEKNNKNILLVGDSFADSIKNSMSEVINKYDYNLLFYTLNDPLIGKISEATILKDIKRKKIELIVFHYQSQVYNNKNFRTKLSYLINNLQIPVYIILPVPEFNYNIPELLYKLSETNNLKPNYSLEHKKHDKNKFNFLKEIDKKVFILDPFEYLCLDENKCLVQLSSKPLYFDSKHLTTYGSGILNDLFEKIILK